MKDSTQHDTHTTATVAFRAAVGGVQSALGAGDYEKAGELLELAVEFSEQARVEILTGECYDRLLQLQQLALDLADDAEGYTASKAAEYSKRLKERQRRADPEGMSRRLGILKQFRSDKGFGFITLNGKDFFFHYRDLIGDHDWEQLTERIACAFEPLTTSLRGPRAQGVRVLD
jgi:cold shock CspA family protein